MAFVIISKNPITMPPRICIHASKFQYASKAIMKKIIEKCIDRLVGTLQPCHKSPIAIVSHMKNR